MPAGVRFVLKRVLWLLTLVFAVSVVAFFLANLAPIDPVSAYAGSENHLSQQQLNAIAVHWGFDQPAPMRYMHWMGGVLQGDWGISVIYQRPVLDVIAERCGTSFLLMGTAWIIAGVLGFVLGILSGMKQGSAVDKFIKAFCVVMAAAPTFWLALIVLMVFSVYLGWFPMGLASTAGVLSSQVTLGDRLWHLFLPALVLSVSGIANITLQTREKTVEARQSDYALFAFARGETDAQFVKRHVLRNVALPAITLQFAAISEIFGGSVLAEQVFSYPGLGNAAVQSALRGDIPLLLGVSLVAALIVFLGNMAANVSYGIVDPRIKQGSRNLDG